MAIVLVTHEPDIARHTARVIVLKDGRVRADKRQTPLVADPASIPAEEEAALA